MLAMMKSPISKKEGYAMYEDTVVSFPIQTRFQFPIR